MAFFVCKCFALHLGGKKKISFWVQVALVPLLGNVKTARASPSSNEVDGHQEIQALNAGCAALPASSSV